jgi:hypothetical protein
MPEPLPQLTEDDVRNMSPEAIVASRNAGQLNEYLGVPVQPPPFAPVDEQGQPRAITTDDLAQMTLEQIVTAHRAGQLRHLGYAGGGKR